jgi:cytochrome c
MLPAMIHEESAAMTMRSEFYLAVAVAALMTLNGSAFATGNAARGKAAFVAKCSSCHQEGLGANPFVGPELNGIVGRDAASVANYTKYSDGLKKLRETGFVWTDENMDKWIADPKAILPDSPMAVAFPGIPDANERADIIAYLKTQ